MQLHSWQSSFILLWNTRDGCYIILKEVSLTNFLCYFQIMGCTVICYRVNLLKYVCVTFICRCCRMHLYSAFDQISNTSLLRDMPKVGIFHYTSLMLNKIVPYSTLGWPSLDYTTQASPSDCNWIRTHNHLIHKWTLNHFAKLTKLLSCIVSTYLYGAFDWMFLSCHGHISEWVHAI